MKFTTDPTQVILIDKIVNRAPEKVERLQAQEVKPLEKPVETLKAPYVECLWCGTARESSATLCPQCGVASCRFIYGAEDKEVKPLHVKHVELAGLKWWGVGVEPKPLKADPCQECSVLTCKSRMEPQEVKPPHAKHIEFARKHYTRRGLRIMTVPQTFPDENGLWVAAWVYVPNDEVMK